MGGPGFNPITAEKRIMQNCETFLYLSGLPKDRFELPPKSPVKTIISNCKVLGIKH